jgi:hypothetical protein
MFCLSPVDVGIVQKKELEPLVGQRQRHNI